MRWCVGEVVYNSKMVRLTISLTDERHERLRYRAAREKKAIGQLIEEELAAADDARRQRLSEFVRKARANAETAPPLSDEELMALGIRLTHEVREEMSAERPS